MTWSLAISNGDISYGQNGLNTVTGSDKLVQDLSCTILEPLGTDYSDPNFGSVIEGGVDADGIVYPGYIGAANNAAMQGLIASEIQRICQNYQIDQIQRNQNDLSSYGVSTLSAGEALLNVTSVQVNQVDTMAYVTVDLTTGTGSVTLAQGLAGN